MAFYHIPNPEFMNLFNFKKTSGIKKEHVACPTRNTGLFSAFL